MDLRDELQQTLGSAYTLERELSGGGMSRVFVAQETALGRSVVVKVLPPELTGDVNIDRFRREILLAAKLQHPHIVPVLAAGEMGGVPYYTMPLVEGRSLRARLDDAGALPIADVVGILSDVAKALSYAHERGVVHRDIKPDNVLLTGGVAVVTDFGIAKALSDSKLHASGATITQLGTSLGTPAYMAPEQAAADPDADHRADTYAFGCMAYELLTGRPPFTGKSPQKLLAAQLGETPQPVTELRADTPAALAALVMQCLEKDAADRPQTANDLVRVLDSVTTSDQQRAMPAILLGGRRMLAKALVAYSVAFIVVAIVAKAAIVAIGLPDWVLPGALIVMALGLPVILFTGYVHYATHRAATETPTLTPRGTRTSRGTMADIAVKASPHMSWRRTTRGGVIALATFVLLVAGFMTLRALGIGPAGSLLAAGKLNADNRVIVADFNVRGADSSVANVVTDVVRTGLSESPLFTVLTPVAVAAAIQRMRRPSTEHVDLALAREVAQREGAKAVITGDVAPLSAGFVISMRLVSADSGVELAAFRETADNPKDLLPTLDKLTRRLRGKAGESLKNVQGSLPLEQVTTSSLEALKKYVQGVRESDAGRSTEAVPLLRQAIALDTTFAAAYRKLAVALRNGEFPRVLSDSASARAYQFRDRLTAREKGLVTAAYFLSGPHRDRARGIKAYEDLLEQFPKEGIAINNLAMQYSSRREFARSESLYREAVSLDPASQIRHTNLVEVLASQGKLDQADSVLSSVKKMFPNAERTLDFESAMAYQRGNLDSTMKLVELMRAAKSSQVRTSGEWLKTDILAMQGRLAESARMLARARMEDSLRGVPPEPLEDSMTMAFFDIWMREQPERGMRRLDAALAQYPLASLPVEQRPYFSIIMHYALAGRADRARAILREFEAELRDTASARVRAPAHHMMLAELALSEKRPNDAIKEFRLADRRSDGPANGCAVCLAANLARAFDQAGASDSALAKFEEYLGTPDAQRLQPDHDPMFLAGTYKRLGELYEAKGDRTKAASNYRKFVELWKNADPDLQPKVAEVRRRIARLGGIEGR